MKGNIEKCGTHTNNINNNNNKNKWEKGDNAAEGKMLNEYDSQFDAHHMHTHTHTHFTDTLYTYETDTEALRSPCIIVPISQKE